MIDDKREIKIRQMIKEKMHQNRLSLKTISQSAGVPYSTLFSWSEGRCPKDMIKAKRLADFLSLTLDELLFGKENKPLSSEKNKILGSSMLGQIEIIIKQER